MKELEANVVTNCCGLRRHATVGTNAEAKKKSGDQAFADHLIRNLKQED